MRISKIHIAGALIPFFIAVGASVTLLFALSVVITAAQAIAGFLTSITIGQVIGYAMIFGTILPALAIPVLVLREMEIQDEKKEAIDKIKKVADEEDRELRREALREVYEEEKQRDELFDRNVSLEGDRR